MEEGIYSGVLQVSDRMGFKNGVKYTFKLLKLNKGCGYEISELDDNLYMLVSNTISIKRYFKNLKKSS